MPHKKLDLPTGATKDFHGKLRIDLVTPEMTRAIAEVLGTACASGKYKERDWELGLPITSVSLASAKRHILKYELGEDIDGESGLHHLKHALTNLAMAVTAVDRGNINLDDRPVRRQEDLEDGAGYSHISHVLSNISISQRGDNNDNS